MGYELFGKSVQLKKEKKKKKEKKNLKSYYIKWVWTWECSNRGLMSIIYDRAFNRWQTVIMLTIKKVMTTYQTVINLNSEN